jgi:hypothetical protein
VSSEIASNSRTQTAGTAQGILLSFYGLVSVAATVLLAPVLPMTVEHFAATDPNAEVEAF